MEQQDPVSFDPNWAVDLSGKYQLRALTPLIPGKLFASEATDLQTKEVSISFDFFNPDHYRADLFSASVTPWENLGIIYPEKPEQLYSYYSSQLTAEIHRSFSPRKHFRILFCGLGAGALQAYTLHHFKNASVHTVEPDKDVYDLYNQIIRAPVGQIAQMEVAEYLQRVDSEFDMIIIDVRPSMRLWDLADNSALVEPALKKSPAVQTQIYADDAVCLKAVKAFPVKSSNPTYKKPRVIALFEQGR